MWSKNGLIGHFNKKKFHYRKCTRTCVYIGDKHVWHLIFWAKVFSSVLLDIEIKFSNIRNEKIDVTPTLYLAYAFSIYLFFGYFLKNKQTNDDNNLNIPFLKKKNNKFLIYLHNSRWKSIRHFYIDKLLTNIDDNDKSRHIFFIIHLIIIIIT